MKDSVNGICIFGSRYLFFWMLLILFLGKLVPVSPWYPNDGLDPSWIYSLSVASSEHLVFGKDIIYTHGPLSGISTGFWAIRLHSLTVLLSAVLAFSLCFFMYRFFEKSGYLVKLLLVLFFYLCLNQIPDFYFTLLPALAVLSLVNSYSYPYSKYYLVGVFLFGFSAAVLLLIKLSYGAEAVLDLMILLVFYAVKKEWRSALILIVTFILSFIGIYSASGQGFRNILYYSLNIYYGVAGYNDAMSANGPLTPVIVSALFLVLFILYIFYNGVRHSGLKGFFSAVVLSLLSLVVFKHSYVRNDAGHQVDMFLLQCFFLVYILHAANRSTVKYALIAVCVLSLLCLGSRNGGYFLHTAQIRNSYLTLLGKARNTERMFDETLNMTNFMNARNSVRNSYTLPALEGSSDIYNFNQALLLASDNKWNPRPAFQSFQAVTPYLAKVNYAHLANSDDTPDNIFFRTETIDGRFPSLDDGLSWKALLGLYKPAGWTKNGEYLILKRQERANALKETGLTRVEGRIGEEIINPYEKGLVFLKLKIRKTLAGALLSVVYKTEPVMIKVKLQNGFQKEFRIIPSMTETGFLLSPMTETTLDFNNLYSAGFFPDNTVPSGVKSFVVIPNQSYQYSDFFDVTFEQLEFPEKSALPTDLKLKEKSFELSDISRDSSLDLCVDSFDYIYSGGKLLMSSSGWAVRKNTDIRESSYSLILMDPKMKKGFEIPLITVSRQDVSDSFGDGHDYVNSGFVGGGLFDASELRESTDYEVFLKAVINKKEYLMPTNHTLSAD